MSYAPPSIPESQRHSPEVFQENVTVDRQMDKMNVNARLIETQGNLAQAQTVYNLSIEKHSMNSGEER
jgi:hypothetical protein